MVLRTKTRYRQVVLLVMAFIMGYCSNMFIAYLSSADLAPVMHHTVAMQQTAASEKQTLELAAQAKELAVNEEEAEARGSEPKVSSTAASSSVAPKPKLLVAIVSFDLQQNIYLQQQLDSFRDVCESEQFDVDIVVYTTVAYTVSLLAFIGELTQCQSGHLGVRVIVKSPGISLHLVDYHRALFYDHLDQYDVFLYTEDDIKISLSLILAFRTETAKLKAKCRLTGKFADYSLGFVRYEHDLPYNVNDTNRKQTSESTRVYWEHSKRPLESNLELVKGDPQLSDGEYVTMRNQHQGFFMATREQLSLWKTRCKFDVATNRPGPSHGGIFGTQRVWMSSFMLFGKNFCNVKQIIPLSKFSLFSVHHLANKNYKRIGERGRRSGKGSEWLRAEEVRNWLQKELQKEQGGKGFPLISMVNEIDPQLGFRGRDGYLRQTKTEFENYHAAVERFDKRIG